MAEVTCTNGHTNQVPDDRPTRFCRECGAPLVGRCTNGHPIEPGTAFCASCGAPAERTDDTTRVIRSSPTDHTPPGATQRVVPTAAAAPPNPGGTPYPQLVAPPPGVIYGSPPFSEATPTMVQKRKGRGNPLLWVAIGLAVVLGVVAVALALTSSKSSTASTSRTKVTVHHSVQTTQPTVSPTSPPTTQPLDEQRASALSGLLGQSANDRAAIVAAVADIGNCGDLYSDQTTLDDAYSSRESLLTQLQSLDLAVLPGGSQLNTYLTNAWQASASSDQSYANWATDESNSGCTVNDHSDVNYQNAQVSDGQSTQNKTSFAAAWDPIATSYGLPTVTASSF